MRGKRILCFIGICGHSRDIHGKVHLLHGIFLPRMGIFIKHKRKDIVVIPRICPAIAKFHGIRPKNLFKIVRVKIYRHRRSYDTSVIFHIHRHSRILTELIVYNIRKSRNRSMKMKKWIHIYNDCAADDKHRKNHTY